jgi:hypothetical protein
VTNFLLGVDITSNLEVAIKVHNPKKSKTFIVNEVRILQLLAGIGKSEVLNDSTFLSFSLQTEFLILFGMVKVETAILLSSS